MNAAHRRSAVAQLYVVSGALLAGWWVLAAWVSRDVRPLAIQRTGTFIVVGLLATYGYAWLVAIARATERRRMVFRAITVTAAACVCTLMLEAPAFFRLINYDTIWIGLFESWHGPASMYIEDRELSFRRPANTSWSGRPRSDLASEWNLPIRAPREQRFTTDSRGFRNQRDRSNADVVLIGDSYVEGNYISDDETLASALERISGKAVVNLAVSGYGTLQELTVLERYALPLNPRMIAWFFFEGNDLYDDQSFENALIAFEDTPDDTQGEPIPPAKKTRGTSRWEAFAEASFSANAFQLLRMWAHPLFPKTVEYFGWVRDEYGREHRMYFWDYATLTITDYERERFEKTKAAFRRGAELARARGIRLVLFYIPMKFRVYGDLCRFPPNSPCLAWRPWNLASVFHDFCAEAGVECVDLAEPMRRAAPGGKLLYFAEDSHWSPAGQEFVAREVLKTWHAGPVSVSPGGAPPRRGPG